jgi:hypothetical protein
MGHVDYEFVLEAPAISSLTISMVVSGNALTLWSNGVGAYVSMCHSLAHGFGFCGGINTDFRCPILGVGFFWPPMG